MSVVPAAGRSLGNPGSRRVNGFNRPSSVDKHVAQGQNGKIDLCSASRGEMASKSESTVLEREKTQKAGAMCLPQSDYAMSQVRYSDRKTKLILKLMFLKLFPACAKDMAKLEQEIARIENRTDRELIYEITKMAVHLLGKWNSIKSCLEDFRRNNWKLDVSNVHMEFSKVAYELFSKKKSWSHFTLFVGFAVSFAIYLVEHNVPVATSIVIEWTCQLVEEDLAKFFSSNGGWEGYAKFLESAMHVDKWPLQNRCQLRERAEGQEETDGQEHQETSLWPNAIAASALAIGAITVFTLKQAFS